jgi:hypothetical protein
VPAAKEALKKQADMRALKQAGAMLQDLRSFEQKGTLAPSAESGKLNAGEVLRKEKVVTPLSTLSDIERRSKTLAEKEISKVNAVYKTLDQNFESLASSPFANALPSGAKMADAIESRLKPQLSGSVALEDFAPQVDKYVERLRALGDAPMKFSEARKQIAGFDKLLNWDKEGTVGKELVKQVRGTMNGVLEESVDAVGKATNFPLYEHWKKAKQVYGIAQDVHDMAADKLFREQSNRFISPSDHYAAGATGILAAMHHANIPESVLAIVAGGTGNHLMRKYGNALVSTGAGRLSDVLANPAVENAALGLGSKVQPLIRSYTQIKSSNMGPIQRRLSR